MTIEATFANASLISPSTCSFAALSIVAPVACPKPTTLSNGRIERVAHGPLALAAWHRSSPQAASDGHRHGIHGRMDVAGFFDGGWYLVQSFSRWAPGRARLIPQRRPGITRPVAR